MFRSRSAPGLGVPALTAYMAVFAGGPVNGLDVLVQGGAGAVSCYAIQFARHDGARVFATVSSPEKAEHARRYGADAIIDYRREDVAARVLALTETAALTASSRSISAPILALTSR